MEGLYSALFPQMILWRNKLVKIHETSCSNLSRGLRYQRHFVTGHFCGAHGGAAQCKTTTQSFYQLLPEVSDYCTYFETIRSGREREKEREGGEGRERTLQLQISAIRMATKQQS